jgi:hypothetical protein
MVQQLNFADSQFFSVLQQLTARHGTATIEIQRLEKLNGPCMLSGLVAVNGKEIQQNSK